MSSLSDAPDNPIEEVTTQTIDRTMDSEADSPSEYSDDDKNTCNGKMIELQAEDALADGQEISECISGNVLDLSIDIIQVEFSDTNDCNVIQRDACIQNAEEIASLHTSVFNECSFQSIITDEYATMDCRTIQCSVSSEKNKDTDVPCTLQEQLLSNQKRSYKNSMTSSNIDTFCECDENDYLNNCKRPALTSTTSKNISLEQMNSEGKNDRNVDFVRNNLSGENIVAKGQLDTIPYLEILLEGEQELINTQLSSPQSKIPDFVILLPSSVETGSKENSESDIGDNIDDRSVIDILNDLRNELISNENSEDFGLKLLFDESKTKQSSVKSKSARKRKKQFRKIQKVATSQQSENRKQKFAQSFEELKSSQIDFEEYGIDSSITCPVCLEMYHLPSTCNPCRHVFCDPCLRRLTTQCSEGIPCPLCRTVISSCDLNKDFDEYLLLTHPVIYTARVDSERHSKYRHYKLPYTPPVPLGKRIMRQLIASRNSQSDSRWMSHDWFKFLLGCTVGMCLSLLLMLFNRVKSVRDARDVNIVFLSILIGASVTFLIFKFIKI